MPKLTTKFVENAKPGRYADGRGLMLRVRSPTARIWQYRYVVNGKEHYLSIGSAIDIPLAEARIIADGLRAERARGIDPAEARRAKADKKAESTLSELMEDYIAAKGQDWTDKRTLEFRNSIKRVCKALLDKPVSAITRADSIGALRPVWKPQTIRLSMRVQQRVAKMIDWYNFEHEAKVTNHFVWRGYLSQALEAPTSIMPKRHHNALPYAELPAFYALLREREGVVCRALEFTILTALRAQEVAEARWDEIDFAARKLTVPAHRMKRRIEHTVPLSDAAITLLKGLPRIERNPYVFIGFGGVGHMGGFSLRALLRRMGRKDITVHGFRSTFSTYMNDTTDFPSKLIEAALAHRTDSAVGSAYARTDYFQRRIPIMDNWAAYCEGRIVAGGGRQAAAVLPMRRKKAG